LEVFALVDNDDEGNRAATRLLQERLLSPAEIFTVPQHASQRETEIEDLFEPVLYLEALNRRFTTTLTPEEFSSCRVHTGSRQRPPGKWSDAVRLALDGQGKQHVSVDEVKTVVWEAIAAKLNRDTAPKFFATLAAAVWKAVQGATGPKAAGRISPGP
jgi:hypothetical protein